VAAAASIVAPPLSSERRSVIKLLIVFSLPLFVIVIMDVPQNPDRYRLVIGGRAGS
jgi:hypothetical protein